MTWKCATAPFSMWPRVSTTSNHSRLRTVSFARAMAVRIAASLLSVDEPTISVVAAHGIPFVSDPTNQLLRLGAEPRKAKITESCHSTTQPVGGETERESAGEVRIRA